MKTMQEIFDGMDMTEAEWVAGDPVPPGYRVVFGKLVKDISARGMKQAQQAQRKGGSDDKNKDDDLFREMDAIAKDMRDQGSAKKRNADFQRDFARKLVAINKAADRKGKR